MKKFFALIFLTAILICGCQNEGKQINSFDDLKHARIGVWPGGLYEKLARNHFPNAQYISLEGTGDFIEGLKQHKIDAFVIGKAYADNFKSMGIDVKYLPQSLGDAPLSYIFPKTERGQNLCNQMNEFLAKVEASGELDALKKKWFSNKESDKIFTRTPSTGTLGKITIATNADGAPFNYIHNQQVVGYEAELIDKFCAAYGYDYEIKVEFFPAMLADVTEEKVNVGMNAVEIMPEREQNVYYAKPNYIEQAVVVIEAEYAGGENFFAAITKRIQISLLDENRWILLAKGVEQTIYITLASIIFGTLLGLAMYMLYREGNRLAKKIIDGIYRTLQGVPILVMLMFFYYVIFGSVNVPASFVAVIVFSIVLSVSVFIIIKDGAKSISIGQTEAALSLGYSGRRAFMKFILPQIVRNSFRQYQLALNITLMETAIVGYISVQDLTKMADLIRARTYDAFVPLIAIAIVYGILSRLLLFATDRIEHKINPKNRSREKILKGVKL